MASRTQSTICNVRTILPLAVVQAKVFELWKDAEFIGATHSKLVDGDVEHCHALIRWHGSVVSWAKFDDWLQKADEHAYARPGRSWRRGVRYLLHLDNAEKARVPRSALVFQGLDEDDVDEILGSPKMKILDSLVAAQRLPLQERFQFLVEERGHLPSEVSAALRCLIDLEKWAETRNGRCSALPEVSSSSDSPSDCWEDDSDHLEGFES